MWADGFPGILCDRPRGRIIFLGAVFLIEFDYSVYIADNGNI